ncbi:hypothetical protein BOX15_Mlig000033g1, partial [Macrostomum lignano]
FQLNPEIFGWARAGSSTGQRTQLQCGMQCKLAVQLHSSDSLLMLKRQLHQRAPASAQASLMSLPCLLYGQIPLSDEVRLASLMIRQSHAAVVTAEIGDRCISITRISGVRYLHNPPWQPDAQFHALMRLHGMSADPCSWTRPQLRLWLHWAARKFRRPELRQPAWESLTGQELAALTPVEFSQLCPSDAVGGELWTHLKLLRRLHMVAVPQQPGRQRQQQNEAKLHRHPLPVAATATAVVVSASGSQPISPTTPVQLQQMPLAVPAEKPLANPPQPISLLGKMRISRSIKGQPQSVSATLSAAVTGSGGACELWKFLLDLLTDCRYRRVVRWSSADDGTFSVLNPSALASVWGRRRGNPRMTFAKISRALRHYQRGGMLHKEPASENGQRYVYRFLCDMPRLLGYSVAELRRLVDAQAAETAPAEFDGADGIGDLQEQQVL